MKLATALLASQTILKYRVMDNQRETVGGMSNKRKTTSIHTHLETSPHTLASAAEVMPYAQSEVGGDSNSWPAKEGHVERQTTTILLIVIAENSVEVFVLQNSMGGGIASSKLQCLLPWVWEL